MNWRFRRQSNKLTIILYSQCFQVELFAELGILNGVSRTANILTNQSDNHVKYYNYIFKTVLMLFHKIQTSPLYSNTFYTPPRAFSPTHDDRLPQSPEY